MASTTLTNVYFDKTNPSISVVNATSSNASTTLAKVNDVVTLTFTSSENIQTPVVTIGTLPATVVATGTAGTSWTASTTITNAVTDNSLLAFAIVPIDWASNTGATRTTVTSGGGVTVDMTGPVITIAGNNPDSVIRSSSAYADAGATATDAYDGSRAVSTSGSVNLGISGTYTLTYSSTDTAGNTSTATRTVIVHNPSLSGGGGGGTTTTTTGATSTVTTSATTRPTIASLQAQLVGLLAQLQALKGGATPNVNAYINASANAIFKHDLQSGSTGDDVKNLQVYLNAHGYVITSNGSGSKGNETTRFGGLTRAALIKLQKAAGITPAAGYFGAKTRAYIAAHP